MSIIINGSTTLAAPTLIGPVQPLLLDTYTGAAAAYSLRKLRTAYTGSAIRVRRISDGAQLDIGFDSSGNFDTASIVSFAGSGQCNVSIWYDQSGNGRDATQTNNSFQPTIVFGGTLYTVGSRPSMLMNRTFQQYLFYNSNIFTGSSSRYIVTYYTNASITGTFSYAIAGQSGSTTTGEWSVIQARNQTVTGDPYFAGFAADLGNGLTTPNLNSKLASFNYNGTTGSLYRNSTLITSGSLTLNASSTTGKLYIGASFSGSAVQEYATAYITEVIIYNVDQSSNRSGIESNINQYYNIY